MPIKNIRVSVKRLVALAKYENVTYECEAEASVLDDENPHEVYDNLLTFCKDKVGAELDRLQGKVVKAPLNSDYVPKGFNSDGTEKDFLPKG